VTEACMYFMCGIEIALMFLLVPIVLLPLLYLFDKHYKKMREKQGHKLVYYATVGGRRAKVCSCGQNYWYTYD
jgi:membrane protein implicated in regulation of membrane protease activity